MNTLKIVKQVAIHDGPPLMKHSGRAVAPGPDLPRRPSPATVEAMHIAVWGRRRYPQLVRLDEQGMVQWAEETERMCCGMIRQTAFSPP